MRLVHTELMIVSNIQNDIISPDSVAVIKVTYCLRFNFPAKENTDKTCIVNWTVPPEADGSGLPYLQSNLLSPCLLTN